MTITEHQADSETLKALAGIPPLPAIATRLIQTLSDETTSVRDVVELIQADPKLSVELLQRANSPLYGVASRIQSVHDALVLLGFDTVRTMALTVVTAEYSPAVHQVPELRRCWRHIVATALIAGDLGRASSIRPDQAYTAGLLHDLGRLGLIAAYPREYTEMLRSADADGQKDDSTYLLDRERERFGIDHCAAGLWLAKEWGLPEELGVAAGRHHDRLHGNEADLQTITSLSCRLADGLGFDVIRTTEPFTLETALKSLPLAAVKRLPKDHESLRKSIEAKINSLDGGSTAYPEEPPPGPPDNEQGYSHGANSRQTRQAGGREKQEKDGQGTVTAGSPDDAPFDRELVMSFVLGIAIVLAAAVFFLLITR